MKQSISSRPRLLVYAAFLAGLILLFSTLSPQVSAQTSESSQLVTWNCTGSPCDWGSSLSGQALVWPTTMGPVNNRLGYTVSAGVYLPAETASGVSLSIASGSVGVYAGLPNAASHRVLTTLAAGQSYTISGVTAGEVVSVQSDFAFTYVISGSVVNTPVPTLPATSTTQPTPVATGDPSNNNSQFVTWNCTSSPCDWGSSVSGHALVWPATLGPITNRLGYTVSAGIYLPDTSASGLAVTIVSGSAGVYAGLPNAASHRVLATLLAGQSYVISGLAAGEVVSVQSDNAFSYTFSSNPPAPTATASATAVNTTVPTPTNTTVPAVDCIDPLTCNPVDSIATYWRCNISNCYGSDWAGAAIGWPSWAAYSNNARSGSNSRTVYNYQGELVYPYMGSWANGCKVTAVSGLVLIIEWQRGTDTWRETYLTAGQSHTITLTPPENGAMIETIDGYSPAIDFSVVLENCTPQPLSATPTATAVVPTSTAVPPTATTIPATATTIAPTATAVAPTATSVQPTATAVVPTPTAPPPSGFPATGILDDFNRANGPIGSSWAGSKAGYAIDSGRLKVGNDEDIYWAGGNFAANQEAYVTLLSINNSGSEIGLILKAQSNSGYGAGLIDLVYDPVNKRIQVWTYATANGWVQHGANIPVTFVNNDQFGARVSATGMLEIFRNGSSIGTRDLSGWPYATSGGFVGLFNLNSAGTVLDNFGGGSVGQILPTPTNTPVPPTATAAVPTATAAVPTATTVPPTATPAVPTATAVPPTPTPVLPTPTATTPPASGFPATGLLDDFNRANGSIGSSWAGNKSGYAVANGRLDVSTDEDIYWSGTNFGATQEAFVTIYTVGSNGSEIGLILKSQSASSYSPGLIDVLYDPVNQRVQVWTYSSFGGWLQHGSNIPVTFANNDQFGARVNANGTVEIFRNGSSIGTRDVSSWPYATAGGYIGLFNLNTPNTVLDNFGGGNAN